MKSLTMRLLVGLFALQFCASSFGQAIRIQGVRSPREGIPPINGQFKLVRTTTAPADVTVNLGLSNYSLYPATEGTDFVAMPRQILFPAGATEVFVDIFVNDDTYPEGSEGFRVDLLPGTGYTLGTTIFVNFLLQDNDPVVVSVAVSDAVVSETGPDGGSFTISRYGLNGYANSALTVYYTIPSHQRVADVDLTFFRTSPLIERTDVDDVTVRILAINIPVGATSVTVPLTPIDDPLNEGPEPFTVTLKALPGLTYAISPTAASATVTISDNDSSQPLSDWQSLYDPLRLRRLDFTFTPANLSQLAGTFVPNMVSGSMSSEGEPPMTIGIARKSGGYKVDVNGYVAGQKWHDVQKFSLQEGPIGTGPVKEGLGWYLYRLATGETNTGLASWVTVYINGVYQGLYLHVEQPNEEFLEHRGLIGRHQSTWFYKENQDTGLLLPNDPAYNTPFPRATFYGSPARPCSPSGAEGCDYADSADPENFIPFMLVQQIVNNIDGAHFPFHWHNTYRVDYYPLSSRKSLHFPWDQDDIHYYPSEVTVPFLWPINNPHYTQRQVELVHKWFGGPLNLTSIQNFLDKLQFMVEVPLDLTPARSQDPVNYPNLRADDGDSQNAPSHFNEIRTWFNQRWDHILDQLPSAPAAAPQIQRTGNTVTLSPSVAGAQVWYTTDGSDPWTVANTTSPSAVNYTGPIALMRTTHLAVRQKSGSSWSSLVRLTLPVNNIGSALQITEIEYRPAAPSATEAQIGFERGDFEFIELQNNGPATLDLSEHYFDGVTFAFPPGAQIAAGARFVLVRNPKAFELRHPGRAYHGVYWDGKLADTGETLVIRSPDGTVVVSINYPGLTALKVTEIHYNPQSGNDSEFLELKNTGTTPLDLSDCVFTSGIGYTFAPGTIVPPGEFVVLVEVPGSFQTRYPGVAFLGVYTGSLRNEGERLVLETSDGDDIIDVTYDDNAPWPTAPDNGGPSLVNQNPSGDPDIAANWRASYYNGGSPGADDTQAFAVYMNTDASTRGDWSAEYGSQGYNVIGDAQSIPAMVQISSFTPNLEYDWPESPAMGGLKRATVPGQSLQYCVHSPDFSPGGALTFEVHVRDGAARQLALYFLDFDASYFASPRTQKIELEDANTGAILSQRFLGSFERGKYITWNIAGKVRVRITALAGTYGNAVLSGVFVDAPSEAAPGDRVWVDEPTDIAGAVKTGEGDPWNWVTSPVAFGSKAHASACLPGWLHQHYFYRNPRPMVPEPDDELYCWVYVEPSCLPTMVMLQWLTEDGSGWEHRAIWGADQSPWGTSGTASRRQVSASIPVAGQWVRLAVPAYQVNLVGRRIVGMAYTLTHGQVIWDRAGTQSSLADSDADGLPDAWELDQFGSLVRSTLTDADGDGAVEFQELLRNSNPNNQNTDGGSYTDGQEINQTISNFGMHTDPSLSDSDGDGLSDESEIQTHQTNPAMSDTDGDSCPDWIEIFLNGTNPLVADGSDGDADGLADCAESYVYGTSPFDSDSDFDDLSDGDEVNVHGTDPLSWDSDWDDWADGEEVLLGTNPLDPASHP